MSVEEAGAENGAAGPKIGWAGAEQDLKKIRWSGAGAEAERERSGELADSAAKPNLTID